MESMPSEKNKTILIIKGYKFRFHKMLQGEVQRWTCCKNSCKCYFKLFSDNVMLKNCNEHNHEKCDEKILNRQKISNAVKRKAVDDVSIRSSTIFTGTNKKLQ
uniref:FLYWCH-type domain-containing protein n=1 Tax=Sipha flava TaxID=143950 RepID=A0A2S2R2D7_9HEMI